MIDSINQVDTQSSLRKECLKSPRRCKKLLALELLRLLATTPLSQRLPWFRDYVSITEPGPAQKTKVTPPSLPRWESMFDNAHWTPWNTSGSWNAALNRWDAVGDNVILEVIGTWADGYRPEKMRCTHLGSSYTDIVLEDKDGHDIGKDINSPSLTEIALTFATPDPDDDIFWLTLSSDDPDTTDIEFYITE